MGTEAWIIELDHIKSAIRQIVTEPADNLCWLDVYQKLAAMVGIEFDPVRLPREQMKAQCGRFIDSIYDGKPYTTDEATAEITSMRAKLARIEQLARRHASPASNPGAHALAAAIIRICEEK
jgi:hypothetical protein